MGVHFIDLSERLYRVIKSDGLVSDVSDRDTLLKECCGERVLVLVANAGGGMGTAGLAGMTMANALFSQMQYHGKDTQCILLYERVRLR